MKTYVKILITLVIGVSLFSGCASNSTAIKLPNGGNKEFKVTKNDKNIYRFKSVNRYYKYGSDKLDTDAKYREGAVKLVRKGLNEAMNYGRSQDYKYMAIVNSGMNNLSGYPLNTIDNIADYVALRKVAHFKPKAFKTRDQHAMFKDRRLNLEVIYFKEKLPGIFLFKL